MTVEVRLFASFRQGRFKTKQLDLPDGSDIAALLKQLSIQADSVGILLVEGMDAAVETELSPGKTVSIFPALGGG